MKPFLAIVTAVLATLPAQAADAQLLRLLPTNSEVMLGVQMDQIRATPFGQWIVTQLFQGLGPQVDALQKTVGFDPRRDIREIAVGGNPNDGSALLAARGNFPADRIANIAGLVGTAPEVYRGIKLFQEANAPGQRAAFLDNSTLLMGMDKQVRAAIDRWVTKTGAPSPLTTDASTASQVWVVTRDVAELAGLKSAGPAGRSGEPNMAANVLSKVGTLGMGMTLSQNSASMHGHLQAQTPQDAQAIADVFQLLKSLADPKTVQQNPLLASIQASVTGNEVGLAMTLTDAQLRQLIPPTLVNPPVRRPADPARPQPLK